MSQTDQNQMADSTQNKPRIITCFVHYNKNDDQSKIFDVLKDFRTRHGLKFSHHQGYIFFTLSSEHLDELSKVRPFKVSKFQTRSEFSCTKEVADKLMGQKDSFVRMFWSDEDGKVTFVSRTLSRIHGQLVRRIFKDSEQQFDRDSYKIIREPREGENNEEQAKPQPKTQDTETKPDGFVKVERKNKTKTETGDKTGRGGAGRGGSGRGGAGRGRGAGRGEGQKDKTKYEPKPKTETEAPKVRGKRTTNTSTKN